MGSSKVLNNSLRIVTKITHAEFWEFLNPLYKCKEYEILGDRDDIIIRRQGNKDSSY